MRINERAKFRRNLKAARLEKLVCGHLTKSFSATANSQTLFLEHKNSAFRKEDLERERERERENAREAGPWLRHTFTLPTSIHTPSLSWSLNSASFLLRDPLRY